jgi:lipoprotein-anchoring transpeptidase ErfK/SrfK
MRGSLAGLGLAYVLASALLGGAIAVNLTMPPPDTAASPADRAFADFQRWLAMMRERAAPPQGITIRIEPFSAPLRGVLIDEPPRAPASLPPAVGHAPTQAKPVHTESAAAHPPSTPAALFGAGSDSSGIVARVSEHLRVSLSRELYRNFDLFLFVSKASAGPLAERMYVFSKKGKAGAADGLKLLHVWPVSTGREDEETDAKHDRVSTATPAGYYQLDPARFYRRYTSREWNMTMPNSMFFNWVHDGYKTGLAIHGVSDADEIAQLGARASAGCVHLSPRASAALFNLVKSDYRGRVPLFAYNNKTQTLSNKGQLARDADGSLKWTDGYRVLVIIENYAGGERVSELDSNAPSRS